VAKVPGPLSDHPVVMLQAPDLRQVAVPCAPLQPLATFCFPLPFAFPGAGAGWWVQPMFVTSSPLSSPIPESLYSVLAVTLISAGLVATAMFFV